MIMPFGKHKGLTLDDIGTQDVNYLGWLLTTPLNPILYYEVSRIYAERTGFTGPIPPPPAHPKPAAYHAKDQYDDDKLVNYPVPFEDTPDTPKVITLTPDEQIDFHMLFNDLLPKEKIEPLVLDLFNRIVRGSQLRTTKTCLFPYDVRHGVDTQQVLDRLVDKDWLEYGPTLKHGKTTYRVAFFGHSGADLVARVL